MRQRRSSRPNCSKCESKVKAWLIPRGCITLKLVVPGACFVVGHDPLDRANVAEEPPAGEAGAEPREHEAVGLADDEVREQRGERRRIGRASATARAWFRSLRSRSAWCALVSARIRATLRPPLQRDNDRGARGRDHPDATDAVRPEARARRGGSGRARVAEESGGVVRQRYFGTDGHVRCAGLDDGSLHGERERVGAAQRQAREDDQAVGARGLARQRGRADSGLTSIGATTSSGAPFRRSRSLTSVPMPSW